MHCSATPPVAAQHPAVLLLLHPSADMQRASDADVSSTFCSALHHYRCSSSMCVTKASLALFFAGHLTDLAGALYWCSGAEGSAAVLPAPRWALAAGHWDVVQLRGSVRRSGSRSMPEQQPAEM